VSDVGAGEKDAPAKRVDERAVLDEDARHRKGEDREPRESHEVDPGEDDDA
jgi:hypothetical protein